MWLDHSREITHCRDEKTKFLADVITENTEAGIYDIFYTTFRLARVSTDSSYCGLNSVREKRNGREKNVSKSVLEKSMDYT